jgi:hypothetical protein
VHVSQSLLTYNITVFVIYVPLFATKYLVGLLLPTKFSATYNAKGVLRKDFEINRDV